MKFIQIEDIDDVPNYLGWMERKVFRYETLENVDKSNLLSDILKPNVFFEKFSYTVINGEHPGTKEEILNHAFTDRIEQSDFDKLTFMELEVRIAEIEQDEDWGDDLSTFKNLITKTKEWITGNNLQNANLYFINSASVDKAKLIENNFYTYFLSIIIVSHTDNLVVIINHGGD